MTDKKSEAIQLVEAKLMATRQRILDLANAAREVFNDRLALGYVMRHMSPTSRNDVEDTIASLMRMDAPLLGKGKPT